MRTAIPPLLFLLLGLVALPAAAHPLAPSFLQLDESPGGVVKVLWKTPRVVARGARIAPELPCPQTDAPQVTPEATAWVARWSLRCPGSLVGQQVAVRGLAKSGTDALLEVRLADGREVRTILSAGDPQIRVPASQGSLAVARDYALMGAKHLATGPDHVLLVLGLLLLLEIGRPLLVAISSFTLGHSVTLALAALGLVRIPTAPADIAIALSLVVLACELGRDDGGASSLLARRPGTMPFAFGLVHGLGFAGALSQLGLPRDSIPLALASFNVGIELGQLGLLVTVLPLLALMRREPLRWPAWALELPATAIGSLGVCFALQRALTWIHG